MTKEEDEQLLKSTLQKAKQFDQELWNLVDGLVIDGKQRNAVSAALQHLSVEHHNAIVTLVSEGNAGSAFALLRPQLEAYIRGVWINDCATDAQIESFLDGKRPPEKKDLLIALNKTETHGDGTLHFLNGPIWGDFCDFTHGGAIQVKARVSNGDVRQNFYPLHVASVVTSSCMLAVTSCVSMAMVANQLDIAVRASEVYSKYFGPLED